MFRKHLNEELKDPEFAKIYEEEKALLQLAVKIIEHRNKLGLTQQELAEKAKITQQQLSKIESGINCNVVTLLKVCSAMQLKLQIG